MCDIMQLPQLKRQALLTSSVFGRNCRYEQLFSLMKNVKSRLRGVLLMNTWRDECESPYPVWWPGLKNSPTVTHACRKRRLKWVPSAWGIAGPPCLRGS
jgi:hypothetical protein